jgi:tRNA uridine 5-carbamoylmethylation protein Kti12
MNIKFSQKLKQTFKTQSMAKILLALNCKMTVKEFNLLPIEDLEDIIRNSNIESKDDKYDLLTILSKARKDEENKDNENYNPCLGMETFSGGINFNLATGFLIKKVEDTDNCYRMDISMENKTTWTRFDSKENLLELSEKIKELKGWF